MPVNPIKVVTDRVDEISKTIAELANNRVMVGVPSESAGRRNGDDSQPNPITSAALGYIHEFGAPEQNIPARPFLIPAVRANREDTVRAFRRLALAALDGRGASSIQQGFMAIGQLNAQAAQRKIADGLDPPLQPATIAARARRHPGRKGAAGEIRPLIDTGQLLQAIRYVIRKA